MTETPTLYTVFLAVLTLISGLGLGGLFMRWLIGFNERRRIEATANIKKEQDTRIAKIADEQDAQKRLMLSQSEDRLQASTVIAASISRLQSDLDKAQAQSVLAIAQSAHAGEANTALQIKVNTLENTRVNDERRIADLEKQAGNLSEVNLRLQAQVSELTTANTSLQGQVAELTKTNSALQSQVAKLVEIIQSKPKDEKVIPDLG